MATCALAHTADIQWILARPQQVRQAGEVGDALQGALRLHPHHPAQQVHAQRLRGEHSFSEDSLYFTPLVLPCVFTSRVSPIEPFFSAKSHRC